MGTILNKCCQVVILQSMAQRVQRYIGVFTTSNTNLTELDILSKGMLLGDSLYWRFPFHKV